MSTLKVDGIRSNSASSNAITLASDGTCTANITSINSTQLSHRRININGGMEVAQRGTSASVSDGSNEGYSTLDRWRTLYSSSAGGVATMSQDSDVPTDYSWGRFSKSLKMDVTTADTSIASNHAITLQYRIEAQDLRNSGWDYTNSNSILSVSFWAKSVKAGTYCVALNSQDGTTTDIVKEYTLAANTWKHIELEFPGNSGLQIDYNNDSGLNVLWALVVGTDRHLTAGSWTTRSGEAKYGSSNQVNFYDSTDNNFFLTGVQIEVGKATVFEHWSYADELARCQRYYYKIVSDAAYSELTIGTGHQNGAYGVVTCQNPVPMRTKPSITVPTVTDAYSFYYKGTVTRSNTISLSGNATNIWIELSHTNFSGDDGAAGVMRITNNSAWIEVQSEL